jgi:hypothetical protein
MSLEGSVLGKRILFAALMALGITATPAEPAAAQSYPNRPVKIIVPFAPGGPTEFIIRLTADRLTGMLRPSSSRTVRAAAAARWALNRSRWPSPTATRCCSARPARW